MPIFTELWILSLFLGVILITSIFLGYKKVISIITDSKNKDSCCDLFRKLNIVTLQSQYIFLLLCFIIMIRDQNKLNSDILGGNRRRKF